MRRLVILRPEPGASASVARARALGLDAVSIPLFEVEPVTWLAPDPAQFDAILLTSANAVRFGGEELTRLLGSKVHAVGQATADAARAAGFEIVNIGTRGVEALLAAIDKPQHLLHLTGEHHIRSAAAGQHVTRIAVYRSREIETPEALGQAAGSVVALHSPRAARRFSTLADRLGLDRSSIMIAGISTAATESAGEGWQAVTNAERPDDSSLLALALQLCDTAP